MNKIKGYFYRQASRPGVDIAMDFVIFGSLFTCVYFGWVH